MKSQFFWLLIPFALAGCDLQPSDTGEGADPAAATPTPPTPPTTSASAVATTNTNGAVNVVERTELYIFNYSWPQQAGQIEPLADWLNKKLTAQRKALADEARREAQDARENGFPFNTYSSGTAWEVVADLPQYLSLSADLSSYRGGAHPNYGFDTMVWDKERDSALEPIEFFVSAKALDSALGKQLCDRLNVERTRRRGIPVDPAAGDAFNSCVKVDETNLLLGSRSGKKFDRIGVQIAPYLAGPYAEGSYEFTFNMTPALLAQVKPEYRDAFATP